MHKIETIEKTKNQSWLGRILLFFIILTAVGTLWVTWEYFQVQKNMAKFETAIQNQNENINKLKQNGQIGEKTRAKEILTKAENYRIIWSDVAQKLIQELEEEGLIEFNNVNAGRNQQIAVNGMAKDLRSIAKILVKTKNHPNFEDVFISQMSQIEDTPNGAYTFSMSLQYVEQK